VALVAADGFSVPFTFSNHLTTALALSKSKQYQDINCDFTNMQTSLGANAQMVANLTVVNSGREFQGAFCMSLQSEECLYTFLVEGNDGIIVYALNSVNSQYGCIPDHATKSFVICTLSESGCRPCGEEKHVVKQLTAKN
jgi:hypothetical protein